MASRSEFVNVDNEEITFLGFMRNIYRSPKHLEEFERKGVTYEGFYEPATGLPGPRSTGNASPSSAALRQAGTLGGGSQSTMQSGQPGPALVHGTSSGETDTASRTEAIDIDALPDSAPPSDDDPEIIFVGFRRNVYCSSKHSSELDHEGLTYQGFYRPVSGPTTPGDSADNASPVGGSSAAPCQEGRQWDRSQSTAPGGQLGPTSLRATGGSKRPGRTGFGGTTKRRRVLPVQGNGPETISRSAREGGDKDSS
ncbi:hypothetical protein TRAPUB_10760 [Trametes pubescens]|uniref:Uncharacterized protein n=1 Tax=Trametes pubescens TaxID=154538 RepID=A0A1M2VYK8_TRAPU|nr:hypothetical protein TRAPUB_10760 [Trametes pubescens]